MSTRCTIKIESERRCEVFYVYHHYDGNPFGVGKDLLKMVNDFKEKRNWWFAEEIANYLIKGKLYSEMYECKDEKYKITNGWHEDDEYEYVIDVDNMRIRCIEIGWDKEFNDMTRTDINLEKTIKEFELGQELQTL